MFEVVTLYVFYVCLFPARGELSYTIFRSAIDPSNLKLKIGGSIDLPFYDTDSDQALRATTSDDEGPANTLRTSNDSNIDATTPEPDSMNKPTEESDYSYQETESTHDTSIEKPTTDGDKLPIMNNSVTNHQTNALNDNSSNDSMDKPVGDRVDKIRKEHKKGRKETHAEQHKTSHSPVFMPVDPALRFPTKTMATKKPKILRVQDDDRIRNFSAHVYKQALKAFDSMKRKTDEYTQKKIDSLAETYKDKFKDFVQKTRETSIRTGQGAQNAILHTIDTSNLIMERIVNFLKTDMLGSGSSALRQGGASRLQKEVDTLKITELEHACKMYGICRSAQGFRHELQNIISTLLTLPDDKLLQVNDAATEILKNSDLSAFSHSNPIQQQIKKAVRAQETTDVATLRSNLEMLFGVLSKSHQPLILDKAKSFEKPAVSRTVSFHSFLDAIEDALPPTEANKKEWASINNRLKSWRDGGLLDVQDTFQALFNNVNSGVAKYGTVSGNLRQAVKDIVRSIVKD